MSIEDMRTKYTSSGLSERDLNPEPVRQFAVWFNEAVRANPGHGFEANMMTLATSSPDGLPSARTVLLKEFDQRGFVFYTNYRSPKALDLAANPRAALVFHWPVLKRQVRITGTVSKISHAESEAYFRRRPRGSQLGAAVSDQSRVLNDRAELERKLTELDQQLAGCNVPMPADWGGYRLAPDWIEFWQGRTNRLHDRLRYKGLTDGTWKIERLAP